MEAVIYTGIPPSTRSASPTPVDNVRPVERTSPANSFDSHPDDSKAAMARPKKKKDSSVGSNEDPAHDLKPRLSEMTELQVEQQDDSGKVIFKTVDRKTGEVLSQIPSEALVNIAKSLHAEPGLLVKKEA